MLLTSQLLTTPLKFVSLKVLLASVNENCKLSVALEVKLVQPLKAAESCIIKGP